MLIRGTAYSTGSLWALSILILANRNYKHLVHASSVQVYDLEAHIPPPEGLSNMRNASHLADDKTSYGLIMTLSLARQFSEVEEVLQLIDMKHSVQGMDIFSRTASHLSSAREDAYLLECVRYIHLNP